MSSRRTSGSGVASRPSSDKRDSLVSSSGDGTTGKKSNASHLEDDDHILSECRAAYISVVKGASTEKSLSSKSELLLGKF